ncbi:MAG: HlyD family type I secretion periplasmic adaptor subunit, partial [Planctomycetales bacterium]
GEGGVVTAILVKDGDFVEAGDVLLKLDPTQLEAEQTILRNNRNELMATIARLEAERDDLAAITFPDAMTQGDKNTDIAKLMKSQHLMFKTQRAAITGRIEQLKKRIDQFEREISGLSSQVEAVVAQQGFVAEELIGGRSLLKKGLVQRSRVLTLEREAARLKGQHGQLNSQIARTQGQIAETELQIIQLQDDIRIRAMTDLGEAEAKLKEVLERLTAVDSRLDRIIIKAPRDGHVQQLAIHTIGGVIAPTETIMVIVPGEDALVIETRVRPSDIDQLHYGQTAVMRFINADSRLTPQIHGEVTSISADLQQDAQEQPPYYLVRLKGNADDMLKLNGLALKPGMPVEAFIQTKVRTPLSYLVKPFSDQLGRAFREK